MFLLIIVKNLIFLNFILNKKVRECFLKNIFFINQGLVNKIEKTARLPLRVQHQNSLFKLYSSITSIFNLQNVCIKTLFVA